MTKPKEWLSDYDVKRRERLIFEAVAKCCAVCKTDVDVSLFGVDFRRTDGLRGECTPCRNRLSREAAARASKVMSQRRPWGRMINTARQRARKRGFEFDLDQHVDLIREKCEAGVCELSGVPLTFFESIGPYSASIDRVDSKKGYTHDNVRLVAWAVNLAMREWGELSFPIFAAWVDRVRFGEG